MTVGPLALGSAEVRSLVGTAPTVIYSTSKREVSLRVETLSEALELPDAIVQARWPPSRGLFHASNRFAAVSKQSATLA